MDETDRSIVGILETSGRASNATIARRVGVSEGTVRRRLKHLIEKKAITITAIPDPKWMGYDSEALIGVQVDPDKIDEVASKLSSLSNTRWVAITTGSYDVFAWATVIDAQALGAFLREEVGTITGVRRTETFVNLSVVKRQCGIPV